MEPIPRDIDKKLYVFDPATMTAPAADDDEDALADEVSELAIAPK